MISPRQIYDILLDYSNTTDEIQEIIIGLTWTLCQVQGIGLSIRVSARINKTTFIENSRNSKALLQMTSYQESSF
jgi:hypothetical protein